jgi:hypothetical protein
MLYIVAQRGDLVHICEVVVQAFGVGVNLSEACNGHSSDAAGLAEHVKGTRLDLAHAVTSLEHSHEQNKLSPLDWMTYQERGDAHLLEVRAVALVLDSFQAISGIGMVDIVGALSSKES